MAQPPERYEEGSTEAMAFLQLIEDRIAADSITRKEFFALLMDFGNGRTTDARAVMARANELLQGHPDLGDRFQAFLDPDMEAKRFLERVKDAGMNIFDDFIANLLRLDEEPELDAHAIYARFSAVFGSANGDMLGGFAQFLPTKFDLLPCAEAKRAGRRLNLKRQHAADPDVDAAECSSRSKTKKPAMDDGHTPMPMDVVGSSQRSSRAKKPRVHYDPEPKCNPISYVGGGSGAVGGSRPSRAMKPRAPLNDVANGTGRGEAARDDGKNQVLRFRKSWEFETGYSKQVATIARVEELQRQCALGAASGSHGRRGASLEELFPSRECREFLANMYHDAWGTMRKLLEHDDYIGSALKVILDRLTAMEAAAVEAARSSQDPTRAKLRLNDLVRDRVREERERRDASGT